MIATRLAMQKAHLSGRMQQALHMKGAAEASKRPQQPNTLSSIFRVRLAWPQKLFFRKARTWAIAVRRDSCKSLRTSEFGSFFLGGHFGPEKKYFAPPKIFPNSRRHPPGPSDPLVLEAPPCWHFQ